MQACAAQFRGKCETFDMYDPSGSSLVSIRILWKQLNVSPFLHSIKKWYVAPMQL